MKQYERPELKPLDIVGEVVPLEPKLPPAMQKMIDEGLAYFNEDGEFCHLAQVVGEEYNK